MRLGGARLVRRALADDGLAADQGRLVGRLQGLRDGGIDGIGVVAFDVGNHVPAVGLEALGGVFVEPGVDMAVDRDVVVVVKEHQLVQLPHAGQRGGFMAHAFHQAAIAAEHVGVVVDDAVSVAVELRRQQLLGQRHADGTADALTERPGGRLDPGRDADLGVARRLAVQLAQVLDLLHRQVVAGEVQQGVLKHRGMAVRQHETVAARPLRVGRVEAHVAVPQRHAHLGHAHRRAGVAGAGLFDRIHRQGADGIGHQCRGLRLCVMRVRLAASAFGRAGCVHAGVRCAKERAILGWAFHLAQGPDNRFMQCLPWLPDGERPAAGGGGEAPSPGGTDRAFHRPLA